MRSVVSGMLTESLLKVRKNVGWLSIVTYAECVFKYFAFAGDGMFTFLVHLDMYFVKNLKFNFKRRVLVFPPPTVKNSSSMASFSREAKARDRVVATTFSAATHKGTHAWGRRQVQHPSRLMTASSETELGLFLADVSSLAITQQGIPVS